jgi:hypothetical protein
MCKVKPSDIIVLRVFKVDNVDHGHKISFKKINPYIQWIIIKYNNKKKMFAIMG